MIKEALMNYNFAHPETVFIRHNENITYAVTDDNKKYLLRIHKAVEGLDFSLHCGDTPRQIFIESEIELLEKLHHITNIKTQCPIKNISGKYVTRLKSNDLVTVLSWLNGETLVNTTINEDLVYQIGQMIGELHNATAQMPYLKRYCYDDLFIDRISKEIKKAYELKHIEEHQYKQIEKVLFYIKIILSKEKNNLIIVHADLSKSNLIYENGNISPIDFSLSGYGIPEMDLCDIIWSLHNDELIPSLLAGYQSVGNHDINKSYIDVFTSLSVIIYIAIHHNKVYKDERFVKAMDSWCNTLFNPAIMKLEG